MAGHTDLHIHTTASDGSWTPEELAGRLREAGITVFSVTDHDTIAGALEMEALAPAGTVFLRGVEFSCESQAGKCHILGYGYDPECPELQAALAEGRALRRAKLERRLAFLRERFGIRLTDAEEGWLRSLSSPGKPHLGKILVARGAAADLDSAIRGFLNGVPGRDRIEAVTAVKAIEAAGGVSVWAHPLGGEGEKRLSRERFDAQLRLLMDCGIRGLECWYSRYELEEVQFLLEQANRYGLLISGGSDCHGENKRDLQLGRLNVPNVPPEGIDPLAWGPEGWYNL